MAAIRSAYPHCLHSASAIWVVPLSSGTHEATAERVVNEIGNAIASLPGFSGFRKSVTQTSGYDDYEAVYKTRKLQWMDRMVFSIEHAASSEATNSVVIHVFSYSTNFCPISCPGFIRICFAWQKLFSDGGQNAVYIRKVCKRLQEAGIAIQTAR